MKKRWGRKPRWAGLGAWALLLAGLGAASSGCAWFVPRAEFEKEQGEQKTALGAIRRELLAHTQILANHGKTLNEVRLQLRDALAGGKAEERTARPGAPDRRETPAREAAPARGKAMYVRSSYQGFPLNYAAAYRSPRGPLYPHRLTPGTEVTVLSPDDRGFTQVEVRAGPLKGRQMWVRTRWLVEEKPAPAPAAGRG